VKYRKEETWLTLRLGEFFHARIDDPASNQPISMVGELHLLWQDRNHDGVKLASVRFYFLPEDSDEGQNPKHGQVRQFFYYINLFYNSCGEFWWVIFLSGTCMA